MATRNKKGGIPSAALIDAEMGSGKYWRAIFDSLADAIIILDKNCRITLANKAAAEFLKLPPKHINGEYFFGHIHGGECRIDEAIAAMLKSSHSEERMLFLEDEGIWARVLTYSSSISTEPESRIVHIIRDVSVEKAINSVLEIRIRELNCLYNLSKLIETKGNSIEDIMEGTLNIIIEAVQYTSIAAARIVLNDREFSSPNWKTTPWMFSNDIVIKRNIEGCLQIAYLEEKPEFNKAPFTKEEQKLLYLIAEQLGRVVEWTRTDALLKEQEENYHLYFNSFSDILFSLAPDFTIKNISSSVEKVLGYKPSELIGTNFIDSLILKPEYHEPATARLLKILAGINHDDAEYEFLDKKGNALIAEIHSAPLFRNNTIAGVISVARDITKRRRAEQELEYINTLLTTQQQTSLDGILIVDEHGEIISYNQRFVEIWGLPADIVESRSNERAMEYASNNVVNAEASNAKVRSLYDNSDKKTHDEISLKDGRTLDRYSAPMVGEDGRYYGRVWYFRDVTQHKQVENEIIQANQKLLATVDKLKERNYQNEILSEMREMLQACSSVSEVSTIIRGSMGKLFPHASGALFMMNALHSNMESVIRWEEFPGDVDDAMFTADECWALRRGRVHLVENAVIGPICPHLKHPPETAYVCLPLVAKGDVLGLLHLRGNQSVSAELQNKTLLDLKELSSTISEYLSLSIANIQLSEKLAAQSIRDPLTGLFNRRYMEESLRREIMRAERNASPIGIVMADIDFFKQFNDRQGHLAGDALLARVGDLLHASIRGADVACRYGGEEFILFLPESSIENTHKRMEKIRKDFQRLKVRYHGKQLPSVTVSIGIASYPDQGKDPETLIDNADAALYRAKQEGRNRIAIAGS